MQGKVDQLHEHLFWSSGGLSGKWAVRSGDWKLVTVKDKMELFDLSKDVAESTNLAKRYLAEVATLTKLYHQWFDQMAEPNSRQPKRWQPGLESSKQPRRDKKRIKKRDEQRKKQKKGANSTSANGSKMGFLQLK